MSEHSTNSFAEHSPQSGDEPMPSQNENVPPSTTHPPPPAATTPSPIATPPSPMTTTTPPSPITLPTPQKTPRKSRKRFASGTPAKASPAKRTAAPKPKTKASGAAPASNSGDDYRLVQLKEEGRPWQEISEIFEMEGRGKVAKGSLAKRYSRLTAKLAAWEENEVDFLMQAMAEVDENRWERVSAKIAELAGGGAVKKFTAAMCEQKARELAGKCIIVTTAASGDTPEELED
ncbi:uncharacterized protein H6S33_008888 [Morchella sextelata]|uniref:uncharacterized protein n=1 Tax=Morchella sextelata TaxID=1174677 RepID=UPI001D03BB3A|nr:uncharacterized protein H6S33_008888 [Morchella sextelata]KAH0612508.1 hypothetical protein H6S33_008888 [Morchella sextelata]